MSSEEYYGYREPRLSNRPQIKRTQLSSQKLIISRSKQREKQKQLQAQQQKLQKLKRKYHQISIDNKEEGKLKNKKNKNLKNNYNIYLNDLRFRLNHYDDQGAIGFNQIIKEKVEKRALQFLQKNFKTKSDLIPTNGGKVNQKAIQQTQQIIHNRLLNRGSRKKYDGYSSRVGRGQMRSCSTNSQRFFQKRRQQNSIQKSERSLNNDNQDYNFQPRNKKNLQINQKQSMVLGTQTIRKPYEEQKNQKSTIKLQNEKKKEEQKNESEISVNSRHENSRITQQLQDEYKNINKMKETQKNEQVKAFENKRQENKLIGSGLNDNRQSYGSVSDHSYVNNSINSNMGRNNYNILATSDYERIKQLEKRARDQSFLRSSKSMTNVNGYEDTKNGEQYNKLLQQQQSSLDLKYQEQQTKKETRLVQVSVNPSSKSNSNTISNLIKNSSDLIKNGVGEYGQSSQYKYNTTQNKKYINNLYSAMSVSNSNSKMGENIEAGMEINKQTSVTNTNTNINQNANMIKNPSNNITFHNIIYSMENSNSNNTNNNKNSNSNSSNFNLHLNSNHNSNNNSNRNSQNISSHTITNIILGRNSNSSKSAQNKSLGLSSDCENYEDILKGSKQLEQRPAHTPSNLNNLNSTHQSLQIINNNQNKAQFILNEEIAQKNENLSDSINETDVISSQSYIKSKKMVRIPLYYATPDQIASRMDENKTGSLSMSNTNSIMRQDKKQTEIQFQFQQSNQVYSLMHNNHSKPNNNFDINNQKNMQRVSLMNEGYENNRWDNNSLNRMSSQGSQHSISNSKNSFNRNYQDVQEQQFHNNAEQSPIFSFSHKQVPKNEPFVLSDELKEWNAEEQEQIIYLYTSFGNEEPQLQTLMDRFYEHITIVNKIADFLSETEQFYLDPQQRQTFHLSMFLLFKFFFQCRLQIIQSLTHGRSCFILTNKEISEQEVDKYYEENSVKQLCSCLSEGNTKLQNILLRFESSLKERLPDSLINLEQIRKQDLNIITQKLNQELQMLVTKIQEIMQQKSNSLIKDNQYEVISLRAFAIMQLIFLISELRGRKIKGFEHVIEPEDFEMYCKKYYGLFKETVLYFH